MDKTDVCLMSPLTDDSGYVDYELLDELQSPGSRASAEAKPVRAQVLVQVWTSVKLEYAMLYKRRTKPCAHRRTVKPGEHYRNLIEPEPSGYAPEFVLKLKPQRVEEGTIADFSCEITGEPKPEVTYEYKGQELEDEAKYMIFEEDGLHHLEIYEVDPADSGEYTVTATNDFGSVTCTADLSVSRKPVPPRFVVKLVSQDVDEGEDATFSAKVTGEPAPEVLWLKDGHELSSNDRVAIETTEATGESVLVLLDVQQSDDGEYTAIASNEAGSDTCNALLNVHDVSAAEPPQFVKRPEQVTAREGERAQFEVRVSGEPRPDVTWSRDGELLLGGEDYHTEDFGEYYTFDINSTHMSDAGIYTATAKNRAGACSADITLSIREVVQEVESPMVLRHKEVATLPEFTEPLQDVSVKEMGLLSLSCRVTAVPRPDVQWFLGGQELEASEEVAITHEGDFCSLVVTNVTADWEGTIVCRASNSAGDAECESNVTITDKSSAPVFVHEVCDKTAREGSTVEFTCTVHGLPTPDLSWFLWSTETELGTTQPNSVGEHVLRVRDLRLEQTGQVTATATNRCGEVISEATLTVTEKTEVPRLLSGLTDVECMEHDTVTLTTEVSGKPVPEVTWYRGSEQLSETERCCLESQPDQQTYSLTITDVRPSDAGLYSVRAQNHLSHVTSNARIKVTAVEAPVISQAPEACTVNLGSRAAFSCNVSGVPQPEVAWYLNDERVTNSDRLTLRSRGREYTLVIEHTEAEDNGNVRVVAENAWGQAEASAQLLTQTEDISSEYVHVETVEEVITEQKTVITEQQTVIETSSAPQTAPQTAPQGFEFYKELQDQTAVEKSQVEFTVLVTQPVDKLTWYHCGREVFEGKKYEIISDGLKHRLIIKNLLLQDHGEVMACCGQHETTAHLSVNELEDAFTVHLRDTNINEAGTAEFWCEVAVEGAELQWYVADVQVQPSDKYHVVNKGRMRKLFINKVSKEDHGRLVRAEWEGYRTTAFLRVAEYEQELVVVRKMEGVLAYPHETAAFVVEFSRPCLNVRWLKNSREIVPSMSKYESYIDNSVTHVLVVQDVQMSDVGEYVVEFEGERDSAHLYVQDPKLIYDDPDMLNWELL